MLIKTKYFGEVDLQEDKVITFDQGMMGFENYKKYALLFDIKKNRDTAISWLQSLDESELAFPVINPLVVNDQYNPIVNNEYLEGIGEFQEDELIVLLTVTVPEQIENITANCKAPILINTVTAKGVQVITDNPEYRIKQKIYDILKRRKEEA